jgi:hypothetical protein
VAASSKKCIPQLAYGTGQGWFTLTGPDPKQQSIVTLEHSRALIEAHHLDLIYEPADLVTTDSEFPNILVPCNPLKPCYSLPRYVTNRWYSGHTLSLLSRTGRNLGYPCIAFTLQNQRYSRYLHILRYRNHVSPIPPEMTLNHWDGDKTNSTINNLHLLSLQENRIHGQLTGHFPSTAGYYGVIIHHGAFEAIVTIRDKQIYIPGSRAQDPLISALVYNAFVIQERLPNLLNPELLTPEQEAILWARTLNRDKQPLSVAA